MWVPALMGQNSDVDKYILEPSALVKGGYGSGSGCILLHTVKGDAKPTCYILTAGHVIQDLRSITEELDKTTGRMRKKEKWKYASIVQIIYSESHKRVGKVEMDAEVVAYSKEDDLALLKMKKKGFVACSIKLLASDEQIRMGTDVYHCGSRSGEAGANSLTDGIISALSRYVDEKEYHQTTAPASPGSSGGGIFLKGTKEYIGLVTMGRGETMGLFIPINRIRKWLGTTEYAFLVGLQPKVQSVGPGDAKPSTGKADAMIHRGYKYWLYVDNKAALPEWLQPLVW